MILFFFFKGIFSKQYLVEYFISSWKTWISFIY